VFYEEINKSYQPTNICLPKKLSDYTSLIWKCRRNRRATWGTCTLRGGSRNYERRGEAESHVSDPSYFIANAHNELYAFYMGKSD